MLLCRRRRRKHPNLTGHDPAQTRAAIAKSERLAAYIDYQAQEAAGLKKWAQERLEANHLTQIFEAGRRRS